MPTNTPEFEPGHDDETVDELFDGRESQPDSKVLPTPPHPGHLGPVAGRRAVAQRGNCH